MKDSETIGGHEGPPGRPLVEPGEVPASWWHRVSTGGIQCDLCPRACVLGDGEVGPCKVRTNMGGRLLQRAYGQALGYSVLDMEDGPLNHFFPGSRVLALLTAGESPALGAGPRPMTSAAPCGQELLAVPPHQLCRTALSAGCTGIAFVGREPTVVAEYAIDCAIEAHLCGLRTIALSSGYISNPSRQELYAHIDAVNIDLQTFAAGATDRKGGAHLRAVLDTAVWLKHQTGVWLEVSALLIPGYNDSESEVHELGAWIVDHLGPDTPLHLVATSPILEAECSPATVLRRARRRLEELGVEHVYTDNVFDAEGQTTLCASCGLEVIGRRANHLTAWNIDRRACCRGCGDRLAGHFGARPESCAERRTCHWRRQ